MTAEQGAEIIRLLQALADQVFFGTVTLSALLGIIMAMIGRKR